MPELPEVQSVVDSLKPIIGLSIVDVRTSSLKLRQPVNFSSTQLQNLQITGLCRIAKYILISLSNNTFLVVHLGMTGKLLFNGTIPNKHNHVIINFADNKTLIYNDPRRFGLFLYFTYNPFISTNLQDKHYNNLALDPLNTSFDGNYLINKLKNRKTAIKVALLNQTIIAGIGNIYASEALYYSAISPLKLALALSLNECNSLAKNLRMVLNKSISLGGSTLQDYRNADGSAGSFQNYFAVYNKNEQWCQVCLQKNYYHKIAKIVQNQRSTFYCPAHQK